MRADWISPWWQAALLPDRWDVAGIACGSMTVWHVFALENLWNHYLCGGPCDRDDAASLLLFSSRDYWHGRRLMLNPQYRAKRMLKMHRHLSRLDWIDTDAACVDYVRSCTRTISRWQRGGCKPCAVPYAWHLLAYLTGGNPSLHDAAWNTPYATARALYDAAAEMKGDDSIMSERAQEMEDNWGDYKNLTGTKKVELA